jgi:hypothetical protein
MSRISMSVCICALLALGSCARDDHSRHKNNSNPPSSAAEQGPPLSSASAAKPADTQPAPVASLSEGTDLELDRLETQLVRLKGEMDATKSSTALCDELDQLHNQLLRIRTENARARMDPEEQRTQKLEQTQFAVARLAQRIQQLEQRAREIKLAGSQFIEP